MNMLFESEASDLETSWYRVVLTDNRARPSKLHQLVEAVDEATALERGIDHRSDDWCAYHERVTRIDSEDFDVNSAVAGVAYPNRAIRSDGSILTRDEAREALGYPDRGAT